jgi:signal transduction histidine kinase
MSTGSVSLESAVAASAPVPPARAESHCRHEVQFYFDERFLITSLAAFVGTALESGTSAIIVATKAHRDSLAQELERTGVGLVPAVEQGRYLAFDAQQTLDSFTVNGSLDKARFCDVIGSIIIRAAAASRGGQSKVAIYGEMVSLLWQRGDDKSTVQLEQFWNDLAHTHSFYLRCGYPLPSFDRETHAELFAGICGQHQAVIPAESYTGLVDENDRLLAIARLQQTEQALKTETSERRLALSRVEKIQSENQQLVEEVQKREAAEDELRRFTRRLLMARDEEQRRIAGELHENTAQLLAALSLYFGVLHEEKSSLSPRLANVVDSSREVAENLLKEIRKLSHVLHPPTLDDIGVGAALKEYAEHFAARSGIAVNLEVSGNLGRLGRNVEIAVFRIVEEALANVRQHSGSASAAVRVIRSSTIVLVEIQDQGYGISRKRGAANAGTGITGMRERARELGGTVRVQSDSKGTTVFVSLPLASEGDAGQAA